MVDLCNRLHNFIVFLLPSIVFDESSVSCFHYFNTGVIANWLRALESIVMEKVKIKIKIYFTPRPMEPEFYNVLVYMYRFNKIMDRTDISDQFKKITMSQI